MKENLIYCHNCHTWTREDCMRECEDCGGQYCPNCIEDHICEACESMNECYECKKTFKVTSMIMCKTCDQIMCQDCMETHKHE